MIAAILSAMVITIAQSGKMDILLSRDDPLWNTYMAYNEAVAYQRAGRHEDAERIYRSVIEQKPDLWEAHNNLGNVLSRLGREDEAFEVYAFGMRGTARRGAADDMHASFLNNMGHIKLKRAGHDPQKLREAYKYFVQATSFDPHQVDARYNTGNILGSLGQTDRAMRIFHQILIDFPDHTNTKLEMGNIFFRQHDYEMAEKYHRMAAYDGDVNAMEIEDVRIADTPHRRRRRRRSCPSHSVPSRPHPHSACVV